MYFRYRCPCCGYLVPSSRFSEPIYKAEAWVCKLGGREPHSKRGKLTWGIVEDASKSFRGQIVARLKAIVSILEIEELAETFMGILQIGGVKFEAQNNAIQGGVNVIA